MRNTEGPNTCSGLFFLFAKHRVFAGLLIACGLIGACDNKSATQPQVTTPAPKRPNFLLIVVDDMGYTDIGSFGSEIATPSLDKLAYSGIRLTNFQVAPTCSPTRAMLLSGVDSHRAGLGNMLEELSPNQQGQPGYEGYLNDRVVTLPTLLRDSGYYTVMSGKWHLGQSDEHAPVRRGFDRAFSLIPGGASHFADMRPAYAPTADVKAAYRENGVRLESLPDAFEYSSQYYADYLIEALRESEDTDEPFFAYLSFTAPHWPLQAPDAAIAKQKGRYDKGYDVLAAERLQRAQKQHVVPENAAASAAPPNHRPWVSLSPAEQAELARAMEVYAAMISEVDRHTGRVIDYLQARGDLENTVVLFMSDNGAEGHGLDETWPADLFPDIRRTIDESHDFSYEAMGKPGSYTLYGPSWAWAGSPAYSLYKAFPTEGGTRASAFISYPKWAGSNRVSSDLISVQDVTPTFLELAGVRHPGKQYAGRAIESLQGRSQVAVLSGHADEPGDTRVLANELFGKRSVRRGDWKIVHMPPPYGSGDWQLFNLKEDLAESRDLSAAQPEIKRELLALWDDYAKTNGVILPDWVSGY